MTTVLRSFTCISMNMCVCVCVCVNKTRKAILYAAINVVE